MPDAECDVLRSVGICRDGIPIPVNDAMTTNNVTCQSLLPSGLAADVASETEFSSPRPFTM